MSRPEPRFKPPTQTYAGYIFDCDGTLADTMPLHFEAWTRALERARASFSFTWELFVSRAGMTLRQKAGELSAPFGVDLSARQLADDQRRFYADLAERVEPVHDVVAFARSLHLAGAPLAVASGSERRVVDAVLQKLGILGLFSAIVT